MLISTMLYLIEILHQTTTARRRSASNAGCILSKFYIKPQQLTPYRQPGEVVSYRNSTSNHNRAFRRIDEKRLYLIEILHQTTTDLSMFFPVVQLYLIEILHQTTTFAVHLQTFVELYLIEILHQTTTAHAVSTTRRSCILSKFYIKPQPARAPRCRYVVVSYRNSTSNHNIPRPRLLVRQVVSYRNSTSNHNIQAQWSNADTVVSYRNSTSNHNTPAAVLGSSGLYLIEILHQTTTIRPDYLNYEGCILSKFYIKPQLPFH